MAVITPVVEPLTTGSSGAPARRAFRLAAGTELLGEYQDSGLQEPRYLVRRSDGQVMRLPRLLYRVAGSLDGRDPEQIAHELRQEFDQHITADDVAFLVENRLAPVGVIATEESSGPTASTAGPQTPTAPVRPDLLLALRYRVGVVPTEVVWRIAGFFRPLFPRPAWVAGLAAFVGLAACIVARGRLGNRLMDGLVTLVHEPVLVLVVLGLTLAAGAFHECGHVTACRFGGGRPGPIGVGLYLVWPSFYSTVTDSYRLNRVGRLRTDLGGVYFNVLFMTGVSAGYLASGQPWLLITLLALLVETLYQFLPSIRLDGYFMLADLIGVPDQFTYLRPVLTRMLPGRRTDPSVRQLRPWARRIIVVWVALVVPALAGSLVFLLLVLPTIAPVLAATVAADYRALSAAARSGDIVLTVLGVFQLLFLVLPWVGLGLLLWTSVRKAARLVVTRTAARRIRAATWRRLRRGSALAVCAAVGAALVWRVARVAASLPGSPAEARLGRSALAAIRGLSDGAQAGADDLLLRWQLIFYGRLTGSFDRHASVLGATRELSVVAAAVIAASLVGLVVARRIAPLGGALTMAAAAVVGPAVVLLATLSPALVGCAWVSVGLLLLNLPRRRPAVVLAGLCVLLGVATAPVLVAPLALVAAVVVVPAARWHEGAPYRDEEQIEKGWWPARRPVHRPRHADGRAVHQPLHRAVPPRRAVLSRCALALVALGALAAAGVVVGAGAGPSTLSTTDRDVVLLLSSLLVVAALPIQWLRTTAAAVACLALLAAAPWPGASGALLPALLGALLLGALLVDAVVRRPVELRPHPLLRAGVAVPVLAVVLAASLVPPPLVG